jgi:16S rRNA (cytosine1402-N4)-methyltransferase
MGEAGIQSRGHEPVLLKPVIAHLAEGRSGTYLDATFGGGGHTRALLEADERNIVVALDCDPEAIERGKRLQEDYPGRLTLHHTNFENLGEIEESGFIGILFDFGVSSFHFDDASRGFSFREDAPLDMRLNPEEGQPASEFLKRAGYKELVQAVRDFGEEAKWRRVVGAIEDARGTGGAHPELCQACRRSGRTEASWKQDSPGNQNFSGDPHRGEPGIGCD